jgi:hypothetical protein
MSKQADTSVWTFARILYDVANANPLAPAGWASVEVAVSPESVTVRLMAASQMIVSRGKVETIPGGLLVKSFDTAPVAVTEPADIPGLVRQAWGKVAAEWDNLN